MKFVTEQPRDAQAYTAGGTINLQLGPTDYTITSMLLLLRADLSAAGAETPVNDYYDRIIGRLTLTHMGRTVFSVPSMRLLYHHTRFQPPSTLRPSPVGDDATNALRYVGYYLHFGVRPFMNGMYNPFDLSAGIPRVGVGNLTLTGTWGDASAPGTNVTVNDAPLHVYMNGVRGEVGRDTDADWMPRMLPSWNGVTIPTPVTSTAHQSGYDIPASGFLNSLTVQVTRGADDPRDDEVLSGIRLRESREGHNVISYGGEAETVGRYKVAEIMSQIGVGYMPPSDNGAALGQPAWSRESNAGLIHFPIQRYVDPRRTLSEYGAALDELGDGAVRLQYGVINATDVNMTAILRKYVPNEAHPDFRPAIFAT